MSEMTIRECLEQIRRDLVDPRIAEQHLRLRVMHDAEAALAILDEITRYDDERYEEMPA